MKTLKELKAREVRYVFTDIDDTLTYNGQLQPEAYLSLWKLHNAGIEVIPVTGRPAGWCELIARQWPVRGIIGENGGFYFYYQDRKMCRAFSLPEEERQGNQNKLEVIKKEILSSVPGSALASDQFCRLMDLAIDFCEDVTPLDEASVQKIVNIFKSHGAQAKISSIHVNGWFGNYDKLTMCKKFCQDVLKINLEANQNLFSFVGDSPNDEPMFGFFDNSVGVANVRDFELLTPPKFVCQKARGEGFKEFCDHILELNSATLTS